jgi:hypothetical protein
MKITTDDRDTYASGAIYRYKSWQHATTHQFIQQHLNVILKEV